MPVGTPTKDADMNERRGGTRMPLRVASLYSGRFFGSLTPRWVANHMENLIRPNNATVVVVSDLLNWCHAPQEAHSLLEMGSRNWQDISRIFANEVRTAFCGWQHVRAQLLPQKNGDGTGRFAWQLGSRHAEFRRQVNASAGKLLGAKYWEVMLRWRASLAHFAQAAALLQEGEFDLLVRTRLDCLFEAPLRLMPSHLSATKVFAVSYLAALDPRYYPLVRQPCAAAAKPVLVVSRPCTRLWRDWLFVGSQAAMAPFWSASILTA